MHSFRVSVVLYFSLLLLCGTALAGTIRLKVMDQQLAAISGARVELSPAGSNAVQAVQTTLGDGMTTFAVEGASYSVRVLAPGFGVQTIAVSPSSQITNVTLHLAPATESVVVSATRTPVTLEHAGADVSSLSAEQLETMMPISAGDALRFLPGAVVNTAGQRGGISSLFVRGGESRYNKVIVDDVAVNEPGGTFDFGVVPMVEMDRVEFLRGAQSTLYGSEAMSSVVQTWSRTGSTQVPELRLGADGGNLGTAHGYLSLAGARGPFDYNVFGDQFNTAGEGINDNYSNSLQGGNIGIALSRWAALRLRVRHSNSYSGVQGEWKFNGAELQPPDDNQWQRQNNLLGSAQLTIAGPAGWEHRFTGFAYNHRRSNVNGDNPDRIFDYAFHTSADLNRTGFEYQGDYVQRSWAQATVGYQFEDENGFFGDPTFPPLTHGLRLNHAVYGQEALVLKRLSVVAGARFVHNESFGNRGVPRVAASLQVLRGGEILSGTRLRFSYATGIKEARFEEAFAGGPGTGIVPNPNLKAEENRSFEAGFQQSFWGNKYSLNATYYNNLFRNQIDFAILDFNTFEGQYQNIDKAMAHGAEIELRGRMTAHWSLDAGYNYTSTQILEQPYAFDDLHLPGSPLLRRPKHSGSLLLNYLGSRWGANVGGSFVGPRPDSDFLGFDINHAAGYARVDLGGWYAVNKRITAYLSLQNALNHSYEEVVGYPALGINVRAGLRFRIGGE
ncbi:MAG: TonB-dependent receptor [Acidobacteria bacterium]|nr:TonB-dependent receptor [Acidobacteriota bacterium]